MTGKNKDCVLPALGALGKRDSEACLLCRHHWCLSLLCKHHWCMSPVQAPLAHVSSASTTGACLQCKHLSSASTFPVQAPLVHVSSASTTGACLQCKHHWYMSPVQAPLQRKHLSSASTTGACLLCKHHWRMSLAASGLVAWCAPLKFQLSQVPCL